MATRIEKSIKVLTQAKKLISKGWIRGYEEEEINGKMHYCAVGAVDKARKMLGYKPDLSAFAVYWLDEQTDNLSIVDYNDKPGRRKQQVVAKFDKAIKEMKALKESKRAL